MTAWSRSSLVGDIERMSEDKTTYGSQIELYGTCFGRPDIVDSSLFDMYALMSVIEAAIFGVEHGSIVLL